MYVNLRFCYFTTCDSVIDKNLSWCLLSVIDSVVQCEMSAVRVVCGARAWLFGSRTRHLRFLTPFASHRQCSTKNVVKSQDEPINFPTDMTVDEFIWRNFDKWSDKTALVCIYFFKLVFNSSCS